MQGIGVERLHELERERDALLKNREARTIRSRARRCRYYSERVGKIALREKWIREARALEVEAEAAERRATERLPEVERALLDSWVSR